jgi:hypothetical protein
MARATKSLSGVLWSVWLYALCLFALTGAIVYGLTYSLSLLAIVAGGWMASGIIWTLLAVRDDVDRRKAASATNSEQPVQRFSSSGLSHG